ncbi:hypothetical protein Patl1_20457 [Pistacia atlantica]|uniref:Uncharacterized protein n=1 Tax=Pistacia atlantica TaxID=434234 RepID=A0ACC1BL71_9ROSI|nr:hypothetical protein Patl1_20457 [Pistacia atlantica]
MGRATRILSKGRKAPADLNLLKVLQSEITHELSSKRFQDIQNGPMGGFTLEYDAPQSQDVVLRRKCESGEEIAVSAMLGPDTFAREGIFPREVLMKVCVKKPGLSSMLHFDCGASEMDGGRSEFDIHSACYLQSATCPGPSVYRGPMFSCVNCHASLHYPSLLISRGLARMQLGFSLA